MTGPLENTRAAWGCEIPDWIETLAIECGRSSQTKVARALDRSGAMISQTLANKYPGDLSALEDRVRGVFMDAKVDCPAMGAMPMQICQDWRAKSKTFAWGNPQRTRMYRACNGCPRNHKEGQNDPAA